MLRSAAALFVALALAACGGGGGDAPADPNLLHSATARAGSLTDTQATGQHVTASYQVIESFTYTNDSGAPMTVRLSAGGQVKAEGDCACFVSQLVRLSTGYTDSNTTRSGADWTDAARYLDVALPAGVTLTAETRVGINLAPGAAKVSWSDFAISLRKR